MKNKFFTLIAVFTVSATVTFGQSIKVNANGDVSVGRIWGQSQSHIFDVKGTMFVSQVPDPPTPSFPYTGVYFDVDASQAPIMRPKWTNTYWIGNSTDQMWRVY